MSERIQKLLATVGVASRREIERLIDEGRILVNGRPAEPGQRIDHDDHVRVDGRPISLKRKHEPARLLIYKKRTGELVTRDDPEGRRTVFRKLPKLDGGRWIAVGRLDINTSGLLLFTNHGELARRLTHPSFEIPRTYAVRVLGTVDEAVIGRWKAGIELDDGVARFEKVERGGASGAFDDEGGESANQWFTVSVREGRNRLVRRLIESQDLQVSRLIRISYGPIELGRGIKSGTAREASPAELLAVLDAVGLSEAEAGLEPPRRGPHGGRPGASSARSAPSAPARRGKPARAAYRDDDDDGDGIDARPQRRRRGPPDTRPPAARTTRLKSDKAVPRQPREAERGDRPARAAARGGPRGEGQESRAPRGTRDAQAKAGGPRRTDGRGKKVAPRPAGARPAAGGRAQTTRSKPRPKHPPRTRR